MFWRSLDDKKPWPSCLMLSLRFPFFSVGPQPSQRTSAWHASRLHHRCRLLRGSEASCERFGSLLHAHWNDQEEVAPSIAVSRAHLQSAHVACLGSARDEVLVTQVARTLLNAKVNPLRRNSATLAQITEHLEALQESGRQHEMDSEFQALLGQGLTNGPNSSKALRHACAEHRAQSLPSTLPPDLKDVVEKSDVASNWCGVDLLLFQ